ncbi:MAG: hypothetical protein IKC71_01860 [Clostridia bacterium]|nr:hypothetical protein [Clostridia bacterium]MBR2870496.1 hypothetical protein [Clostridia bacterium]
MAILKKVGKIFGLIILCLLGLFVAVISVLNVAKFAIYAEYYSITDSVCRNPGLGDGFVCQGVAAVETENKFLVSGYMANGTASRIYVTDKDNNDYYVSLYKNGEEFDGHLGGVAYYGDKVFTTCNDSVQVFSLTEILSAKKGDIIEMEKEIPVNNQGSSLYVYGEYLYVGEFNNGNQYKTEHHYGDNHAIITKYSIESILQGSPVADKIYSIPDKVQGICFTPDGKIVLSTSWAIADSYFYVYNESEIVDSGEVLDGAKVYHLGNSRKIKGPAMVEGLDYYAGKIITVYESASNKYFFGKMFFAHKIDAIDINN